MSCVAVCQLNSTPDVSHNFEQVKSVLQQCAQLQDLALVVLPECFASLAPSEQQYCESLSEPGIFLSFCKVWAKQHDCELVLGGINITHNSDQRPYNTAVFINSQGEIAATYGKMHLFDVELPDGQTLKESNYTHAGNTPIIANSTLGLLGLSICYDVRFPELFNYYANHHVLGICVPAAFTQTTGELHWEVLLRARAIETQSYIFAAAQTGEHYTIEKQNSVRSSYGHAMIIDPLGKVIALKEEGVGIISAQIDEALITKVRTNMPIQQHKHSFFER